MSRKQSIIKLPTPAAEKLQEIAEIEKKRQLHEKDVREVNDVLRKVVGSADWNCRNNTGDSDAYRTKVLIYDTASQIAAKTPTKAPESQQRRRNNKIVEISLYDTIKACSKRANNLIDTYGQEDDKWMTNSELASHLTDNDFKLKLDSRDLQVCNNI
jgi:hypothetical protein